jgi:hypothetical protein
MISFLIYTSILIVLNSLRSLKDFNKIKMVYDNLNFYNFNKDGDILIANKGLKNQIICLNNWHFILPESFIIMFDFWTLVDFHLLYWILKFNLFFKKLRKNC